MPIIGTAIFGFGLMTSLWVCSGALVSSMSNLLTWSLPIQLYLVDTFTYAASATAAASVSLSYIASNLVGVHWIHHQTFRSLLGFVFPLFGEQMFAALGYGGGNSLLAGIAIVIGIPFPVWIYFSGERMRMNNPLSRWFFPSHHCESMITLNPFRSTKLW